MLHESYDKIENKTHFTITTQKVKNLVARAIRLLLNKVSWCHDSKLTFLSTLELSRTSIVRLESMSLSDLLLVSFCSRRSLISAHSALGRAVNAATPVSSLSSANFITTMCNY